MYINKEHWFKLQEESPLVFRKELLGKNAILADSKIWTEKKQKKGWRQLF